MKKEAKGEGGIFDLFRRFGVLTPTDEVELKATGDEARSLLRGLANRAGQLLRNSSSLAAREFPPVNLAAVKVEDEVLRIFSKDEALANLLFAFKVEGDVVQVAVAQDSSFIVAFHRALKLGKTFKYFLASSKDLRAAIVKHYKLEDRDECSEQTLDRSGLEWLMRSILIRAAEQGATEIHFIPGAKLMAVEYRSSAAITKGDPMPKKIARTVISGFKQECGFGSTKRGSMQNGTFEKTVNGHSFRIVLVTGPSEHGEIATLFLTPIDQAD